MLVGKHATILAKTQPLGYGTIVPTVIRVDGFVIKVYTRNEHRPPHVHVIKSDGEIRVKLGDARSAPSLWDIKSPMSRRDLVRAVLLVDRYHDRCLTVWRLHHGDHA